MKRRVFYAVVLVLMAVSFNSCEELLEDCEMCELVKYINGVEDDRGTPIEYCGLVLEQKKLLGDIPLGTNIIGRWECQ